MKVARFRERRILVLIVFFVGGRAKIEFVFLNTFMYFFFKHRSKQFDIFCKKLLAVCRKILLVEEILDYLVN